MLHITRNGPADFTFVNTETCGPYNCSSSAYNSLTVSAAGRNAVGAAANALRRGNWIGAKRKFDKSAQTMLRILGQCSHTTEGGESCQTHTVSGSWGNVTNRFLALKFFIRGEAHYGWARFNVSTNPGSAIIAKLTGYAYETIPYKAIQAGQTKESDVIAVPPGSLGALAAGVTRPQRVMK